MRNQTEFIRYTLRIPGPIYERIKDAAGIGSVNAEIVARLEASFSAPSHDHDAIKQALREALEERENARPERPTLQVQERTQ